MKPRIQAIATPIRYRGTKRHMAHRVSNIIRDLGSRGRVVDLFSGMGCVAEALAGVRSVVTNDALSFTTSFARARFTAKKRSRTVAQAADSLKGRYRDHVGALSETYRAGLRAEQQALDEGPDALREYLASARHVANSSWTKRKARAAALAKGSGRYSLTTLYFSAGYFGLRQAIQLDALRYAIDLVGGDDDRDWLLSAWIASAATLINAPGHTAQFLKPNTLVAFGRIKSLWRRSVWAEFQNRLIAIQPVGAQRWRDKNDVRNEDALKLLGSNSLTHVGAIYADPPYTKDQYSRFYHVYETLYRYDFPDSVGEGRVRSDRFSTGFCLKSEVEQSFASLFERVGELRVPLVLSYPSDGLLHKAGAVVPTLVRGRLRIAEIQSFEAEHSTLGASMGSRTKTAMENLYVCEAI